MGRVGLMTALAIGSTLVMTGATAAQERSRPGGSVGFAFVSGEPVGELALFFDHGFGAQLDGTWPMSSDGRVRLRADLGLLV